MSLAWWHRLSPSFCPPGPEAAPWHSTDCLLLCQGGRGVRAHRLLIALASPLLEALLLEQEQGQEEVVLMLPWAKEEVVRSLLEHLYTGGRGLVKGEVRGLAAGLGVLLDEEQVEEERTTFLYVQEAESELASDCCVLTGTVGEGGSPSVQEERDGDNLGQEVEGSSPSVKEVQETTQLVQEEEAGSQSVTEVHCSTSEIVQEVEGSTYGMVQDVQASTSVVLQEVLWSEERLGFGLPDNKVVIVPLDCSIRVEEVQEQEVEQVQEQMDEIQVQEQGVDEMQVQETVNGHLGRRWREGPSPKMQCPSCGKVLSRRHYQKHHRAACTGEVVLSCGFCGKEGFCTSATLKDHVRAKHTAERPYKCDLCGKAFPATSHLAHHRMKKHSVNSKGEAQLKLSFPCPECGKVLTTKPKLLAHLRVVHQGIKDFSCVQCPKSFSSKSNLDIHVGSAHTGVLPYKCDLCNKSFTRKSLFVTHSKTIHKLYLSQNNAQPVLVK